MTTTALRKLITDLWQQKGDLKLTDLLQNYAGEDSGSIDFKLYLNRTLFLIRYLLFFLTAFFYLLVSTTAPLVIRFGVVFALFLATALAQNLYRTIDSDSSRFKLIIIESLAVVLLVLPTGVLDSPFIWYAFNPILAAAIYLPGLYSWGILFLFLAITFKASHWYLQFFHPGLVPGGLHITLYMLLRQHFDLVLLFLILTSLARIAATLYKGLASLYEELVAAHETTERSLEHVSSLYQALESVSGQGDREQLARLLAGYAAKLCRASAACFLDSTGSGLDSDGAPFLWLQTSENMSSFLTDSERVAWEQEMYRLRDKMRTVKSLELYPTADGENHILFMPLRAHGDCFGFLTCMQPVQESRDPEREKALVFLAELGAIILERIQAEKMGERLLLSEEQNRIANEIHDGVSQYLFSITCALHTLSQQKTDMQNEKVQEKISLLKTTATRAAAELRSSIYKISPQKQGKSVFLSNLSSYMDDLARLNSIRTTLETEGSEEVLSPALRKGLYRIIREAAINAIKHGKCNLLAVRLQMQPGSSVLEIEDDGSGYQPELIIKEKAGLGLHNIKELTERFNGELEIQSTPGQGTLIKCTIPKKSTAKEVS